MVLQSSVSSMSCAVCPRAAVGGRCLKPCLLVNLSPMSRVDQDPDKALYSSYKYAVTRRQSVRPVVTASFLRALCTKQARQSSRSHKGGQLRSVSSNKLQIESHGYIHRSHCLAISRSCSVIVACKPSSGIACSLRRSMGEEPRFASPAWRWSRKGSKRWRELTFC